MQKGNFFSLIHWELEEYLTLPVIAFIIVSAIFALLTHTTSIISKADSYLNLYYGSGTVFLFLTFVAGALFSRSFAGSIARGEIKLLLSYPVKRWKVFVSKFTAMFVVIFAIYGVTFSLHIYLDVLSPFEPLVYLSLFAFLLQLMLSSVISITFSLVTKNEIMSVIASVLLLLGIENVVGTQNYLSAQGRFKFLFAYFSELIRNVKPFGDNFLFTTNDVVMAILVPVLIFALLFILSFVYYTYFMEID